MSSWSKAKLRIYLRVGPYLGCYECIAHLSRIGTGVHRHASLLLDIKPGIAGLVFVYFGLDQRSMIIFDVCRSHLNRIYTDIRHLLFGIWIQIFALISIAHFITLHQLLFTHGSSTLSYHLLFP